MTHTQFSKYADEFGLIGVVPTSHGIRQPLDHDAPTGPAIGARLPDFTLPAASGGTISFHEDRDRSKAAVVFFRSAVW